jgi:serine/threonine protein kinase
MTYFSTNKNTVEDGIEDFFVEAKRLNKNEISHPNIVRIGDAFKANNTAYYEMEYVDGVDLLRYIKDTSYNNGKPLSQEQGISIIFPILQAVALLHQHHITHLDIKPENIILTKNEVKEWRPVLIDFGLSKHYDKKGHVTSSLNVAGCTDGFAPMEQYQGLTEFTPQADVYALGATLLFLLSAKWPAKSAEINANKIRASLPNTVSANVVEAIVSAMKSDKNERTQSVTEFASNLGLDISTNVTKPIKIKEKSSVSRELKELASKISAAISHFNYRRLIKPVTFIVLAGIFGFGVWRIGTTIKLKSDIIIPDTIPSDTIEVVPIDSFEVATADSFAIASEEPINVAAEERIPTNDELFAKAKTLEDFKSLADKGYSKAYAPLASKYFFHQNYYLADKYVRLALKSKSSNASIARDVAEKLNTLGFYDNGENGGKPE